MEKVYRTKIDLRVLGDEIKFNFFISGQSNGKGLDAVNISKRPSFNFSYNTMYACRCYPKSKRWYTTSIFIF